VKQESGDGSPTRGQEHTRRIDIKQWWARLDETSKQWLIDHNGEALPGSLVAKIVNAGGPVMGDAWWSHQDGASGFYLPDDAARLGRGDRERRVQLTSGARRDHPEDASYACSRDSASDVERPLIARLVPDVTTLRRAGASSLLTLAVHGEPGAQHPRTDNGDAEDTGESDGGRMRQDKQENERRGR
jgi:hypothetical protein